MVAASCSATDPLAPSVAYWRTPQGEIPPSGRCVEFRWSATCEARGDELVSEHLYFDQLELLAQLGVGQ